MSSTLTADIVRGQESLATLEKEFNAKYQAATQSEATALKANLAASVAAHRLGVIANRLQPLVSGNWTDYVKAQGMKVRTVQRAMRIAKYLTEEECGQHTLAEADDLAAAKQAVARGNVASVNEWQKLKKQLAEAREALEKQESEREAALAKIEEELEQSQQHQYEERIKKLDAEEEAAAALIDTEAKAQADENIEAVNASDMAAILAVEDGKVSIPKPRAEGEKMPVEVAAALGGDQTETKADEIKAGEEVESDLLSNAQIDSLAVRLREIVTERPNEVKDTIAEAQEAVDGLVTACHGDPAIAFAVLAIWLNDNGL